MKILVSNDDGYHATGINELFNSISSSYETIMIAPDRERSSCGHAITLTKALRVNHIEENKYTCSGFPADCILVGLGHTLRDAKPNLVISGINHGPNLGQDRFYSGTMAAAREAVFRGIPAIAVSLVTNGFEKKDYYNTAAFFVKKLLEKNAQELIPSNCLLNINVPSLAKEDIKGIKITSPGVQKYTEEVIERVDFRDTKYYWVGGRYEGSEDILGSDCNCVLDHCISVDLQAFDNQCLINVKEKLNEVINCIFQEDFSHS